MGYDLAMVIISRPAGSFVRAFRITLLLLLCVSLSSTAWARPSNKWRIKFNHRAKSYGEIVFSVQPEGGELVKIRAVVEDGMGENTVAKVVRNAFRDQLPAEVYHIETDDGEDVLVKKRRGQANFELHLLDSSVENVRISIRRE